jgi:hypothetical protein
MRLTMTKIALVSLMTAVAGSLAAQTQGSPAPEVIGAAPLMGPPPPHGGMITMRINDLDAAPVKGAPFCGTIATEHTQVFADGNRIHTSENSSLCRDSDGRIRREASLNLMGAAAQVPETKIVTIIDPVAGYRYMLDSNTKTARRMPISGPEGPPAKQASAGSPAAKDGPVMIFRTEGGGGPGQDVFYQKPFVTRDGQASDDHSAATENLGDQSFDGIHATGTRMTTTIPSGKMGNDQPITVTTERWYSPELKATVMTKHSDPWAGEVKTQLTSVSTSQPDASLFAVPSDYKIVDDKAMPLMLPPLPPPPGQ